MLQPRRSPPVLGSLALIIVVIGIGAAASAHAFAEPADQATHPAQEHHACAIVLGLDPSEAPYQDCVAVLERNLPPRDPPPAIASAGSADRTTRHKANAACADIGLEQGSLGYGRCVLDVDQTLTDEQQIYR
jgi:hypothetical protein